MTGLATGFANGLAMTGWAVRTALGHDLDELCDRLLAGERAASDNPRFDARSYPCSLAAAIPGDPAKSRHDRILRRTGRFGYHAALEALQRSGVTTGTRLGLFAGVGGLRAHWNELMPALAKQRDDLADSWRLGFRRMHPYWMLQHLSNNTHALLSKDVDARGEGVTFGGANAGAQALAAAGRALRDGAIDAALVVTYDSLIEPETIIEMAARGAVAGCAAKLLRAPYDLRASGAVPGEAAAAVVLEAAPIGDERPERPILGYLSAEDGADGNRGLPSVTTLEAVARLVVGHADVGHAPMIIDGAAAAIADFDRRERAGLAALVGPDAQLTAIQSALGHLGAGASIIQALVLARCLQRGRIPPIAGLREPAPGPLMPLLTAAPTEARSALAVTAGSPGLVGALRVDIGRPHRPR